VATEDVDGIRKKIPRQNSDTKGQNKEGQKYEKQRAQFKKYE
jgi:hypothetical protein